MNDRKQIYRDLNDFRTKYFDAKGKKKNALKITSDSMPKALMTKSTWR